MKGEKMRKSKFMTKFLAVVLAAGLVLSGCSDKGTAESSDASSVAQSVESKTEEGGVQESETEESKVEESSIAASDATSVNAGADNKVVNLTEVSDWGAHYKEFFKNYTMDGKQINMHFEGEESGMHLVFDMLMGSKDGNAVLSFNMTGQDGGESSLAVYVQKEGPAYMDIVMAGQGKTSYKTASMGENSLDDMNLAGDYLNTDEVDKMEYVGEETIDGVLYDVLKMNTEEDEENGEQVSEVFYYVNRNAQELEKLKVSGPNDLAIEGIVSEMGELNIPADLLSAEEIDSETFAMSMVFGLFGIMAAASGEDLGGLTE